LPYAASTWLPASAEIIVAPPPTPTIFKSSLRRPARFPI